MLVVEEVFNPWDEAGVWTLGGSGSLKFSEKYEPCFSKGVNLVSISIC